MCMVAHLAPLDKHTVPVDNFGPIVKRVHVRHRQPPLAARSAQTYVARPLRRSRLRVSEHQAHGVSVRKVRGALLRLIGMCVRHNGTIVDQVLMRLSIPQQRCVLMQQRQRFWLVVVAMLVREGRSVLPRWRMQPCQAIQLSTHAMTAVLRPRLFVVSCSTRRSRSNA